MSDAGSKRVTSEEWEEAWEIERMQGWMFKEDVPTLARFQIQ